MAHVYIVSIQNKRPTDPTWVMCPCQESDHCLDHMDQLFMANYFCRYTIGEALNVHIPNLRQKTDTVCIWKVMPDSTLRLMNNTELAEDLHDLQQARQDEEQRRARNLHDQRSIINTIKH